MCGPNSGHPSRMALLRVFRVPASIATPSIPRLPPHISARPPLLTSEVQRIPPDTAAAPCSAYKFASHVCH